MANGFVRVRPDSTGKRVDTEELTVGGNLVERQRIQVAGAIDTAIASVLNAAPGDSEYGLTVRVAGMLKAEDSVHVGGDRGMFILGVHNSIGTVLVDGLDYCPIAVDNNGDVFVKQRAAFGVFGTELVDDPVSSQSLQIGSRASTATPPAVGGDGRYQNFWLTRTGVLHVRGHVAHDDPAEDRGIQIVGRGSATTPTATSAEGDAAHLWLNRNGALNVRLFEAASDGIFTGLGAQKDETGFAANNNVVQLIGGAVTTDEVVPGNVGALKMTTRRALYTALDQQTVAAFDHGRKSAIGTTAVAIASTATARHGVHLRADSANSAAIYIGASDVTADAADGTDGLQLAAGDRVLLNVSDPSLLFAIAASGSQKLFYWFS